MVKEVALVTVSCVLFIQMGLASEIQKRIRFRLTILSCPKCATFWSVLAYLLIGGNGIILSVATSFISAYSALWLSLLYDILAKIYNVCYEAITETDDTPTDAQAGAHDTEAGAADEVSKM